MIADKKSDEISLAEVTRRTKVALGQYFTPRWAAEAIVERHFGYLESGDLVIEPSCGDGQFLMALPEGIRAIGVEVDPALAATARARTGFEVLTGDFRTVDLPSEVDGVIGNPPFVASTVEAFLKRAHGLLREGGTCGFILPAYVMQTSSKVMAMSQRWSVHTELLPRTLFPRLSKPILFARLVKQSERRLFGFMLYQESAEIAGLHKDARELMIGASAPRGSVWRHAVHMAFDILEADEAPLSALYRALSKRRPTENGHFEAKCRQVLQSYPEFAPISRGVWRRVGKRPASAGARLVRESLWTAAESAI